MTTVVTEADDRLPARNVLGEPLEICSFKPMTGFYRDGCCNTGQEDTGSHTVCAVMTSAFLDWIRQIGVSEVTYYLYGRLSRCKTILI
jgi:uncharacterized protein